MNTNWFLCRLRRPHIILCLLAFLVCFLLFNFINLKQTDDGHVARLTRRNISDSEQRYKGISRPGNLEPDERSTREHDVVDLELRIEDLKRIKLSLRNELRLIERDRDQVLRDKTNLINRNEKLLAQINKSKLQLKQLDLDISANRRQKFDQISESCRTSPIVFKPLVSVNMNDYSVLNTSTNILAQMPKPKFADPMVDYYFDLSACPLTKDFKFSVPRGEDYLDHVNQISELDSAMLRDLLESHQQFTNLNDTCLDFYIKSRSTKLNLKSRNNLIIEIEPNNDRQIVDSLTSYKQRSVIASSSFLRGTFRNTIDLVIPGVWQPAESYQSLVGSIPHSSPIARKYLASYLGKNSTGKLSDLEDILRTIHSNTIDDLFWFVYDCDPTLNEPCYNSREGMIELSMFLIILPNNVYDSDSYVNELLYLALSKGSIPVIIGKETQFRLPFDEVIDWRRAAVILPTGRLPELHLILRSIGSADLYRLKHSGRRIFENYLATSRQIIDTIISVISLERFNQQPPIIGSFKTDRYLSNSDLKFDTNCTSSACLEASSESMTSLIATEIFGPREKPFASQSFRRNFSLLLNSNYDLWNHPLYSPKHLYPSIPIDPVPPSEFKYTVPDQGYRPIGDGLGGSGLEFSRSIGGDYPNEQFTIVLLTYERTNLLMKTLERLKGLAYLNKIVVVWNGVHKPPTKDIVWPDVGVEIVLVRPNRNSLNNRFVPYDVIETDAIFSMDDDSPLRPDEIVFAFRVWRQSRDRIVGFPGRYHAWDGNQQIWMYNSNHSCELSMVLTGGAFYHRYYNYVYSYFMQDSIRTIVDKFMNCEDIAMNFLVAHLTRQPPIKVTSRWTFHCASCVSSLSEDESHFQERHECLNIFASIYGYMPLLTTQHRSDSILFKTRLPADKQKCFKFV